MKTFFQVAVAVIAAFACKTARADYPVSAIPDSLLKSAHMVKRFDMMVTDIKGPGKARIYHKYAYTILDEAGQEYAEFAQSYDKFTSISSITGTLYDASGNKMKQVKKKDIEDQAVVTESDLALDYRYKLHNFFCRSYPYTIEYEFELEVDGLFFLDNWHPVNGPHVSVQNSTMVVNVPVSYELRYKQYNYSYPPDINTAQGIKRYNWQMKDMPAMDNETYSPNWNALAPQVRIAPTEFEMQGYKGKMDTWEHFGQFMNDLYKGRNVLPSDLKQKIHQLVDTVQDVGQKIRVLYRYMQDNTHYISIQLGIGGWQPFDAAFVATKKYGDCKALSNFMCTVLHEAGITAYSVLVHAGEHAGNMDTEFPSNQFNHVIACVPLNRDTMWLECTSQTMQPGFMGSFTGNRKALLLGDDGGHVVSTPRYGVAENQASRHIDASIDATGNLKAQSKTRYSGELQETPYALMHQLTGEQREKYLNATLNLPTYTVSSTHYEAAADNPMDVLETLQVESPNYATVSGKRLFVQPNVFNKSNTRLQPDLSRKYKVECQEAERYTDSVSITIPEGYTAESIPKDISVSNEFGKYQMRFTVTGRKIEALRVYEKTAGNFPAADYQQLVDFTEQVYKGDRARIVLAKTVN